MLNQTAEHALRTAVYLAEHEHGAPARAADLAAALGIPTNYLSKILHQLARSGLLVSQRGRGGGFRLAKPAESIQLSAIVLPFDALAANRRCILGRARCRDSHPCRAHEKWKMAGAAVADFFHSTSLAELAQTGQP